LFSVSGGENENEENPPFKITNLNGCFFITSKEDGRSKFYYEEDCD
jgi:hypothetical protein